MSKKPEKKTTTKPRCWWCAQSDEYTRYHDEEWGYPVKDDVRLFEKISLEGFQSGLSWLTILNKRRNFRESFNGFDFEQVAKFGKREVSRLLKNEGIIRHRGKIEATINNAQRAIELVEETGSLAAYVWQFEPPASSRPKNFTEAALKKIAVTDHSKALAKDLKKRGWKFFGPTTAYAFMQAMGLVNDHTESCFVRKKAITARKKFKVPAINKPLT